MEEIIKEALDKGNEMLLSGEYDLACQLYESIIQLQADHADANHNMGLLKLTTGHDLESLPFLQTALHADTTIAQFWLSYIKALIKVDRMDVAARFLDLAKESGFEGGEFAELNKQINERFFTINQLRQPNEQLGQFLKEAVGGIDIEEGFALSRYASEVEFGDIVEIGSYKGKSAVALADGIRQGKNAHDTRLFCIDPHQPFIGQRGGVCHRDDRADFFKVMLETGTYQQAALINLPANQVVAGWTRPIGMLFIDGDHRYHEVREDFMQWVPHVLDGGIIALDDSIEADLGPTQLVSELNIAGFAPLERCGKITFYRKIRGMPQAEFRTTWRSILIAAEYNGMTGGLLRCLRLQRALKPYGVKVSFTFDQTMGEIKPHDCEVLSFDRAQERKWDATLLPGAGFSDKYIDSLSKFQSDNFGTRVQLVLNDQTLKSRFLQVNSIYKPHSVIFNSAAWVPGSFTDFSGDRFAVIEGAVDATVFAPRIKVCQNSKSNFVVGLQAKYLDDLAAIVPQLPHNIVFRVIRMAKPNAGTLSPILQDLFDQARLEFLGTVGEADLQAFYHSCDCVLHLEKFAGWANLVAEAMACAVPVVCSPFGTQAIAKDGITASVVDPERPETVAAAILDIINNPESAVDRARAAREQICKYDWSTYAAKFLKAANDDGRKHYVAAEELGFHGKWSRESRLQDIDFILPYAPGATVLDIGCAEGLVSKQLSQEGANLVHGFDIDPGRITAARGLLYGSEALSHFRVGSVAPWHNFAKKNMDLLLPFYDIVLFLAVYQHLPHEERDLVLHQLLSLSKSLFAIRTPDTLFQSNNLHKIITKSGFTEIRVGRMGQGGSASLRLYKKDVMDT